MSAYPGSIPSFTNPTPGGEGVGSHMDDEVGGLTHAEMHGAVNDEIEAIAGELGTTPSGAAATVAARFDALDTTVSGKQPLDSDLTAIAALTTTSYGRALLALADLASLVDLFGVTPQNWVPELYAGGVEVTYGHTPKLKGRYTVNPITNRCEGWCYIDLGQDTTPAIVMPSGALSVPLPVAPYSPATHDGVAQGVGAPLVIDIGTGTLTDVNVPDLVFPPYAVDVYLDKLADEEDHAYFAVGDGSVSPDGTGVVTDTFPVDLATEADQRVLWFTFAYEVA